jgi:hypothetical protein
MFSLSKGTTFIHKNPALLPRVDRLTSPPLPGCRVAFQYQVCRPSRTCNCVPHNIHNIHACRCNHSCPPPPLPARCRSPVRRQRAAPRKMRIKITNYSLCPKLVDTFNKNLYPKLDDLFLIYPNLDLFGNLTVQMQRNTAN